MFFAAFKERFGEFASITEAQYDLVYAEALRRCDADIWGDKLADGVMYLTAHLLAVSPYGQQARLVSKAGESTYGKVYSQLKREVCAGYRVL